MATAISLGEKSTIGRLSFAPRQVATRLFRGSFQLTARLAPRFAAKWAKALFFAPPRARRRPREHATAQRGKSFTVFSRGEPVVGRSWGEGPVVLLVHGWGGHSGQLWKWVDPLVRAGYQAVAVDLPGH